eukprot:m.100458 g.100458  ORF g.100458 m.100458 type:complete len:470 (-) comp13709_c0_seq2:78-1487(-)
MRGGHFVQFTPKLIDIPGVATMPNSPGATKLNNLANSFYHRMLRAALDQDFAELFGNQTMIELTRWKWESLGRILFWWEIFIQAITVIVVYLFVILNNEEIQNHADVTKDSLIALAIYMALFSTFKLISIFGNVVKSIRFIIGGTQQLSTIFPDHWMVTNFLQVVFLFATFVSFFFDHQAATTKTFAGLAALGATFNSFYYLQGFPKTGALVRMCVQIIKDVFLFGVLIAIILLGVTFFYYALTDNEAVGDGAIPTILLRMYVYFVLGDYNDEDFDSITPFSGVVLGKVVFAIISIFVTIVLLNLLIAIMNDSYGIIKAKDGVEWRMQRAQIIVQQENFCATWPFRYFLPQPHSANWLHLLIPNSNQNSMDIDDVKPALEQNIIDIREELEILKKTLQDQDQTVNTKLKALSNLLHESVKASQVENEFPDNEINPDRNRPMRMTTFESVSEVNTSGPQDSTKMFGVLQL